MIFLFLHLKLYVRDLCSQGILIRACPTFFETLQNACYKLRIHIHMLAFYYFFSTDHSISITAIIVYGKKKLVNYCFFNNLKYNK